jgi:hypothetical protein
LIAKVPMPAELEGALSACCKELIEAEGGTAPGTNDARYAHLEALLAEKRSKTFAIKGFDRKPLAEWSGQKEAESETLGWCIAERDKVDEETEKAIADTLKAGVDAQSETIGWQELIDLAAEQKGLRTALIDRAVREQAAKELTRALRQIDNGNETVLDKKFTELSGGVQKW